MTGRERKFKRDKESKIECVISAWNQLIAEKGYAGFSINDVPERAGVSIGTIYRYFPKGKADILGEAMKRNVTQFMEALNLDTIEESEFASFWREVIRRYIELRREDLLLGIALRETGVVSPELTRDLTPIIVDFYGRFAGRFQSFSFFKNWPPERLMLRIHAVFTLMGTIREIHLRRPLFDSDEEMVRYLLSIVLLTFEMPMVRD
ncbi:MAG: TetR/AcrR family transcriptional regulator [Candidatus Thorarchaeota archaeon]